MQRLILSAFSVLLATAAIAPTAQALPKIDSGFNLQTLRLSEFDARNKSDDGPNPYYPQATTEASPEAVTAEEDSVQTAEPTDWDAEWEAPESDEEDASPTPSVTERRHQSLDRS